MAQGLFNLKQVTQAIQQKAWPNLKTPEVDFLVVAGGGGAGASLPGGAGAGGLLVGSTPVVSGSAITVTIGAGGSGASSGAPVSGTNSVFGSQTAIGGGKGGNAGVAPADGGSGGGTGGDLFAAGRGTVNQGFQGGYTYFGGGGGGSSGGGGAGGIGQSTIRYNIGGQGGNGLGSVITGTMTGYGGGGAGSTGDIGSGFSKPGTAYGGGGAPANPNGGNGTANTGGGGGGAPNYTGGSGGSGIVVLSYPDVYAAAASTTGSPTVSTSGSGSISFNGTSQFVGYANNAALQLTGDFTVEGWFYITASTGLDQVVFSKWNVSAQGYLLYYNSSQGKFYFVNTAVQMNGSATQSFGQYYHVAITRSGNNYVMYINGTSVATATSATTATDSGTALEVGRNSQSGTGWTNGYISNFRIVKGTAVYTGNFTPSTTPLTAVSGTSILLNTVSGAPYADGSTNSFATTTATSSVGPWNASSPFSVTGYKNRVYTWTSSGSITF